MIFNTAATWGEQEISSSWKLDSSSTTRSSGSIWSSFSSNGLPMLPPTHTWRGARTHALNILPTRVVVVVLPAEPVIPITGQVTFSKKSCESFVKGMHRRRASTNKGMSSGTPPETHTRSIPSSAWMGCPPVNHSTLKSRNALFSVLSCASPRWSFSTTRAPFPARKRARAKPCRAAPITSTCISDQDFAITPPPEPHRAWQTTD